MKKLFIFYLLTSVLTMPAMAEDIAQTEGKIKQMLARDVMSASADYSGDITLQKINGVYNVTIPGGTLKETNQKLSPFSFLLPEQGKFSGQTRYHVTLDKLSQVIPALVPIFDEYKVTYGTLTYNSDIVPALDFTEKETLEIENLSIPFESNTNMKIDKLSISARNDKTQGDKVSGTQKISAQGIQGTHMFGTVQIQQWDMDVVVPMELKAKTAMEDIQKLTDFKQSMSLSNVNLDSLFSRVTFNLKESLDVSSNDNKEVNAVLKLDADHITVQDKPEIPQAVSANVKVSGFTTEQTEKYTQTLQAFNQIVELPDGPQKNQMLATARAKVDVAQNALFQNMVVNVEQIKLDSDKYQVVLKGTGYPKKQQFNGTLTVVNFDYLAPTPRKVDEAACQAVMNKVLDGSLSGKAFETEFHDKCNEQKGILDALRPYASTAKKTTLNGKDALSFDIKLNGDSLLINGKPFNM